MQSVQIFGLTNCPATRAADRFFKERRIQIHFVDLKKKPMSPGEVRRFIDRFTLAGIVNKEGKPWLDAGLQYMKLSESELLAKIENAPRLLRLPLVRAADRLEHWTRRNRVEKRNGSKVMLRDWASLAAMSCESRHRGAVTTRKNTIESIELALTMGVDVVEIDVHRSRDGHLIVMHDERVDRTTKLTGNIRDMTRDQLPGIPTLDEALAAVKGKAALMIELKVRGIADDVVSAAQNHEVYFASFLHSELLLIRELKQDAKTIALLDAAPVNPTAFALEARASHAGLSFSSLERNAIHALHDEGIEVFTWTVDDPRDIAQARELGVDGIISNFPDRLL